MEVLKEKKNPLLRGTAASFFCVINLEDEKTKASAVEVLDREVSRGFAVASHKTFIMKFIRIH